MIYQHATRDRDKAIALALGTLADRARTAHDLARGWPPAGPIIGQHSKQCVYLRERATGIEPA